MKRNLEDYKILVRNNENEEFKEIQCVEHGTEEMIVGVSTEAHITHWITFIDENGTLRKQSFKNEDVKFELVNKINPIINVTTNNISSEEFADRLSKATKDMFRRIME